MSTQAILQFDGEYLFLSNFYVHGVDFEGLHYLSTEAAYQAAKTLDLEARKKFTHLCPADAKKQGRRLEMRPDWNAVKFDVMRAVLRAKFQPGTLLAQALLDTGDVHLEEGNWWNDTCWGVCRGVGENWLGKLLMELREELREG